MRDYRENDLLDVKMRDYRENDLLDVKMRDLLDRCVSFRDQSEMSDIGLLNREI